MALGFVTEQGGRNARSYKYAGTDLSLMYKYLASPLSEYLVTFVPKWVAPNVITLAGMTLIVLAHLLLVWYSPDLAATAPLWVYTFQGVCLWVYGILDNMDGKQARRTNSSSPLGLLFDHGCDAFNAGVFSATSFCCAIGTGPTFAAHMIFVSVIFPFYMCTWEEFHVHEFVLPIINGPNEGILLTNLIYFYASYAGNGWAAAEGYFGMTVSQNIAAIATIAATGTTFQHIFTVAKKLHFEPRAVLGALSRLGPCAVCAIAPGLWMYLSPAFVQSHFRILYLGAGCAFSDSVMKMVLAHVCQQPFMPSFIVLAALFLGPANAYFGIVPEAAVLYTVTALSVANVSYFVAVAIQELKEALNVYCFSIKRE